MVRRRGQQVDWKAFRLDYRVGDGHAAVGGDGSRELLRVLLLQMQSQQLDMLPQEPGNGNVLILLMDGTHLWPQRRQKACLSGGGVEGTAPGRGGGRPDAGGREPKSRAQTNSGWWWTRCRGPRPAWGIHSLIQNVLGISGMISFLNLFQGFSRM